MLDSHDGGDAELVPACGIVGPVGKETIEGVLSWREGVGDVGRAVVERRRRGSGSSSV
jgi:hypothetical protein